MTPTILMVHAMLMLGQADPYAGLENPVTKQGCCASTHCKSISRELIYEGDSYYEYDGLRIPKNQKLPSFNGSWHVCPNGLELLCILVPDNT